MVAKRKGKKTKLEDKLSMKKESVWLDAKKKKIEEMFNFSEGYKKFLDGAKTEREAVKSIVEIVEKFGFRSISTVKKTKPGDKLYTINRGKNIALIIIGSAPIENGLNVIASHIDSPRLDLKQHPLYEDKEAKLALLKTHYYGGIKKYQWVGIPLSLHGRIVKKDGKYVDVAIGEKPGDPIFTIPDLLPHLAGKTQENRKLYEGIKGEELNVLAGSMPLKEEKTDNKIKLWVLDYFHKKYGTVEEDLVSAELEVVPAFNAMDVGFDKSLVGAYGQDDRICAYTSLMAMCDIKKPRRTCIAVFYDKEEIGSEGNTGAKSILLESIVDKLLSAGNKNYGDSMLRKIFENTKAVSADVTGGVDPSFKDVHELSNAAKLGYGTVISKFTGGGGKYSASDASAEYVGEVRQLLNKNKIAWQSAELGKVDEGGGGTVAKFLAKLNMDIIDCGPALIGMHSPFEVSSKADVYSTYEAYRAFFEKM
ncbi:MAG: aminopeptidase [Thermoplasmata archaeon]